MIRIPDIVRRITQDNPLLMFGLQHGLFNLSQLSKYLQPMVEVRTRKPVQPSAILMALSRQQRQMSNPQLERSNFAITHIDIHTGLITYTFPKTATVQDGIQKLHRALNGDHTHLTVTQGTTQVMLIIDASWEKKVEESIQTKPLFRHRNISAIGISFDKKYVEFPGMLYIVLQQISLQNINIIELSSTYTELVLYMDENDTKVAFETLYALFKRSS